MNVTVLVLIWRRTGGLETVNQDLVRALVDLGHKVSIISVFGIHDEPAFQGTQLTSLVGSRGKWFRRIWGRWIWKYGLIWFLKAQRPRADLYILGHVHFLDIMSICPEYAKQSIAWIYGIDVWGSPGKKRAHYLQQVRTVISISQFTIDALNDDTIKAKTHIIPCCIDTDRFVATQSPENIRRNEILICGRLASPSRSKGHDVLFRALPLIEQKLMMPCVIRVVGTGADQPRLEQLARTEHIQDRVIFSGRVSDHELIEAYQHCGVFCMPTPVTQRDKGYWNGEGFGIVYIEAAACGRPVIASTEGGAPETIIPGETGLLVDPRSPESVAEAVSAILSDPHKADEMGRNGRAFVVDRFSYAQFRVNIGAVV